MVTLQFKSHFPKDVQEILKREPPFWRHSENDSAGRTWLQHIEDRCKTLLQLVREFTLGQCSMAFRSGSALSLAVLFQIET
jgi:hypothetical protein